MRRVALLWPGVALTLTMVDDIVAGPVLALGGALLGPWLGIPVGAAAFGVLVLGLAWSTLVASRELAPSMQARIDEILRRAAERRFIGSFVHRVGDQHLMATAIVAAVVSPVFAVLLARLVHPDQRLHRTVVVAALAYSLVFAVAYATGGTIVASALAVGATGTSTG